jgi:type IV secretory pathway TrbD component
VRASQPDQGIGFNTPQGRFSISPSGFRLGGSERAITSVAGMLGAALVTLAALAAFAAACGVVTVLGTIRRTRATARARPLLAPAEGRTRQQLYSEARRQNIRGRSSMTKAQLERALSPRGVSH